MVVNMNSPLSKFVEIPMYEFQPPFLRVHLVQVPNCISEFSAQHHFTGPFLHCLQITTNTNFKTLKKLRSTRFFYYGRANKPHIQGMSK
jgi:hypothetical protein